MEWLWLIFILWLLNLVETGPAILAVLVIYIVTST